MERCESGVILQLQSFSVHDGEGIRTVVFLAGCPLRCRWCANPESWTVLPKLAHYSSKCSACGTCRAVCPKQISPPDESAAGAGCDACGLCVSACPARALTVLCKRASVREVVQKVRRDEIFYRHSGGGVTFSGGEPLAQHGFLRAITEQLQAAGIDMWIETCGYYPFETAEDIFARLSHVFYDLKCMDDTLHRELTGVSNSIILENAARIHAMGLPMTVRIPCIKGLNLTEENLLATARFMREKLPGADIELLPYHNLGAEKYRALGMQAQLHSFETPDAAALERAKSLLREQGVQTVSYQ